MSAFRDPELINTCFRYQLSQNHWHTIKVESNVDTLPKISHLRAVQINPGKQILLFGKGFPKTQGLRTGVILGKGRDSNLQISYPISDSNQLVPELNSHERTVLVDWKNTEMRAGSVWTISIGAQDKEFSLLRFNFNLGKDDLKWVKATKKTIPYKSGYY